MGLKDFERQKIRCDQNLGVSTRTWRFNWLYPRAIKHCWKIPNVSPQDIPEGKYIFTFYARILDKKTSTCLKPASRISGHGSGQSPPKKKGSTSNLARSDSRKLLAAARSHAGAAALSRSRQMRPDGFQITGWMEGIHRSPWLLPYGNLT